MSTWQRLFKFFTEDTSLIFLLSSISLLIFIIYPLSGNDLLSTYVANLFILIMLFSGIMSLDMEQRNKRRMIYIFLVIIILAMSLNLTPVKYVSHFHLVVRIIFLWILVVLVFKKVFRNKPISFFFRIAGSITIYLLISLIWANMYFIFYILIPDSYHFNFEINPDDNQMNNFVYFSLETLTTLGLGDIIPKHPFVKSLMMLEAVLGPVYLAVTIGRLVSKQVSSINDES